MKKYISPIIVFIGCFLFLCGCTDEQGKKLFSWLVQAPPSAIEYDTQGHDAIFKVQITLRFALKKEDPNALQPDMRVWYAAFGPLIKKTAPIPLSQEIILSRENNEGKMQITSTRKHFDVVKGKNIYYALDIKYYDRNGSLINHQFGKYDPTPAKGKDDTKENSLLEHHQTFFLIQNYSVAGEERVYPMTLDSIYYDKYTFQHENEALKGAGLTSALWIYAPEDYKYGANQLRYNRELTKRATALSMHPDATKPYTVNGTTYNPYITLGNTDLIDMASELFSFEYRDTDPLEKSLGTIVTHDDYKLENGNVRPRFGKPTQLLRQRRSLEPGTHRDQLGFKGILNFKKSNIAFQMRVALCHIQMAGYSAGGKYGSIGGHCKPFDGLQKHWNSFDADYPIGFRVIADADEGMERLIKEIKTFNADAKEEAIRQIFNESYDEKMKFFRGEGFGKM